MYFDQLSTASKQSLTTVASLVALIALPLESAIAQQDPIQEVIVTAKGNRSLEETLPTTHVLNRSDIELAQAKDLTALLDSLSGISVRDSGGRGSATSVFVRGTSNSQIIVLIDGVRVGSASLGAAALNTYPIEAIDRIEIVKGPLSGIYGADAAGGVIHLFTKKDGQGLGSANVSVGTDSLVDYGLAFNGGNDKHSFHISAQAEETDGIDHTSIISGGNDDDDGFEETSVSVGAKLTLSENTIAKLSVLYSDGTVEFDNTFGADTGFETDTKTLSSAISINSTVSDVMRWNTTLGINEDESVTEAFFSDITTKRNSIGTELQYDLSSSSTVTVGVDYYDEELETTNNFPVTDRDNKGVFALIQSSNGAFGFVGSLRHDDNSAYGSDTNGSLAASYDFNDSTRLVASYGTAFSAPSFNFLYFPFFGNPDLLPEESDSIELSLMGETRKFDWRISAYQNDFDNLFSFDPNTFLAANIGSAEIKGLELELNTTVMEWAIGANLDLLSAEDKDSGVELDDRAETTLALSAARSFDKLDLRINVKFEDGRFDSRGTELDSYGLLDISGQYRFNDKLSLLANIDNIFDKDYTLNLIGFGERYNTEGRQAKLTVRYQF